MTPLAVAIIAILYFSVLFLISFLTGKDSSDDAFFVGNKKSPWYLVAFGMIGASLSGITFISVPGAVGGAKFGYMQMVLGYLLGYFIIATVLLPIYYKLNLTSIYTYLEKRLGVYAYKTGAAFFLLSRIIGAALRLYLVAAVLQLAIFNAWGVPFAATVAITILLIWLYTFRSGIRTIVFTDSLQTFFMLLALVLTIFALMSQLNFGLGDMWAAVNNSEYSKIFFWELKPPNNFVKQFLSGAFIAIVMTGLDQDMMQKNLSCRSLPDAKKNMFWFSIILMIVNFVFLILGALMFIYMDQIGIDIPTRLVNGEAKAATDLIFPNLALNHTNFFVGAVFFIGLLAAAYSSADSALTALTTSFCIDFLGFQKGKSNKKTRYIVHIGFSVVLFIVILIYNQLANDALIWDVFKAAMFTYGPILGLFAFGILTKRKVKDNALVILVCILALFAAYHINKVSGANLNGFEFGFLILPLNGFLTFIGLYLISVKDKTIGTIIE